jgi:hypothetical protein
MRLFKLQCNAIPQIYNGRVHYRKDAVLIELSDDKGPKKAMGSRGHDLGPAPSITRATSSPSRYSRQVCDMRHQESGSIYPQLTQAGRSRCRIGQRLGFLVNLQEIRNPLLNHVLTSSDAWAGIEEDNNRDLVEEDFRVIKNFTLDLCHSAGWVSERLN